MGKHERFWRRRDRQVGDAAGMAAVQEGWLGTGRDQPLRPWMGRDVLGWVEMSVQQLGSAAQGWSLPSAARGRLPAAAGAAAACASVQPVRRGPNRGVWEQVQAYASRAGCRTHASSVQGKDVLAGIQSTRLGRSLDEATSLQHIWKTAPILR